MKARRHHILVDTDVWVGFILENDPHHRQASALLEQIRARNDQIVITSAIIGEAATVLSYKAGQDIARKFLTIALDPTQNDLLLVFVKNKFFQETMSLFGRQAKKGTSYVDCCNVTIMRAFEFDHICAFDKVYHRIFGLVNIAYSKRGDEPNETLENPPSEQSGRRVS